jgi:hypothetical protein
MNRKKSVRADDEITSVIKQDIWVEWHKREKELEDNEPKCICGLKDYKRGYHYMKCPYLNYWADVWIKFAKDFENNTLSPTGLELWMK